MAECNRRVLAQLLSRTQLATACRRNRSTATTVVDLENSTPRDVLHWEDLPGPMSIPLLGTTYVFMRKKHRENLHLVTEDLVKKYGKVMRMQLGPNRAFGIADANLMEEITRQEDPLPIREAPLPWLEYLKIHNVSGGLLTSQDEDWSNKRKAVRALMLKPFVMEDFIPEVQALSEDFCNHIAARRDSSSYVDDIPQHLYRFSFDGIVTVMFGERAGCIAEVPSKHGDEFIDAVSVILDACFSSLMTLAPLEHKLSTKQWQNHERAWDKTKQFTEHYINRMVKRLTHSSELGFTPIASSLIANQKLSDLDTKYMLMEFLFGGVDTTSNSLGFILHNLASHPDKQQKLREEILQHSGDFDLNAIKNMKYLNACIKESLRLYPILFINGRKIRNDFTSSEGIHFKAEDRVMFFHYLICRDPDIWPNPDQFIPERFDRAATTVDSPERKLISIPFGFGTRGCIGKRIAEVEMALCIISVITRFDLTIDHSRPAFQPCTRSLMTPGKQIPIRFKDRM